jgi:hypothetical protein
MAATPSGSTPIGPAWTEVITLEGRSIGKGPAPGRDEAANAVSRVLEELLS